MTEYANAELNHDGVTQVLFSQIISGIDKIDEVNETLLVEETGTPVREIDKALKDKDSLPDNIKKLSEKSDKAYAAYRKAVEEVRNAYRTEVLEEEAKEEKPDVDLEDFKNARKVVMDTLTLYVSYATQNGLTDHIAWANTVSVPQVGRQGSSSVGAKKPRVFVFVDGNETPKGSFGEAAAEISTKENKITAGELAQAWRDAGAEEGEFKFAEHTFRVANKPKKSEQN